MTACGCHSTTYRRHLRFGIALRLPVLRWERVELPGPANAPVDSSEADMRAVPGFMVEQERKRLSGDLDLIRSHGGLDTDRSVVRIEAQLEILDAICARVEAECLTGNQREASAYSGYSEVQLWRMAKDKDIKNVGRLGAPEYVLSELPIKPGHNPDAAIEEILRARSERAQAQAVRKKASPAEPPAKEAPPAKPEGRAAMPTPFDAKAKARRALRKAG